MKNIVRYNLQSNPEQGLHPEKRFEKDGLKVIQAEASTYGDCWFLRLEEMPDPLPEWYTEIKGEFNFTHPDKKFSSDLDA